MENTLLIIQFVLSSILAGIHAYGMLLMDKKRDYTLPTWGFLGFGVGIWTVVAIDALNGVLL